MKFRWLIALLLCLTLLLCGCGTNETAATAKPLPDCETLAQTVLDSQTFEGEMTLLTEKRMLQYLCIESDWYTQAVMWLDASMTTPEMVVVITAADTASADKIEEALNTFRSDILSQYENYKAGEAPKLENSAVQRNGLQLVLVAAPDSTAAQSTVLQSWK